MRVIWRIAFRNLREHKVKTLIIGAIVTIGVAVLVVGNSLMDTASAGIEKTYISNYTGHIIITGVHKDQITLFGVQSMDHDAVTPRIPDYEKVVEYVSALPNVTAVNPQATASVMIAYEEKGQSFTQLFGIDPVRYQEMFPDNIEIIDGEFIPPGEQGILLSERVVRMLERESNHKVVPGESVLLTGMNAATGIKVREVVVRGIFRFKQSNVQLDFVSLIDIDNLRALAGMTMGNTSAADLSDIEQALLGDLDEESLFGSGEEGIFGDSIVEEADISQGGESAQSLYDILGDTSERERLSQTDSGAWHFLLLRLDDASRTRQVMADLQQFFAREGIEARASDWLAGAGSIAQMAQGIKNVFNIIVLVIAVVAVIIIMNTLVISVTERIAEIGTMRAVGAQKSFVRSMIAWETIMISGIFGLLGVVLGSLILLVLNMTGLQAPNMFFEIIFGGKVLHPGLSASSVAISLIGVAVIGVVSSLYPVSIALKIKPVRAMQGS